MAAVQLDLAVCSGLHLESSYAWLLFGKFTCSALGFHLECTWTSLEQLLRPSKAFKSLRMLPKAFKVLTWKAFEGPSKALKGLRRPPQACKGLTSKAFKGLENPSKASLGRPLKAFEACRMRQQSSRGVPRASRRPKARFARVQKVQIEPERESEHSIFPSSALVSTGKSVHTHCIEHCFCYHG